MKIKPKDTSSWRFQLRRVVHGPAAPTLPGSLWETRNLKPHLQPHWVNICILTRLGRRLGDLAGSELRSALLEDFGKKVPSLRKLIKGCEWSKRSHISTTSSTKGWYLCPIPLKALASDTVPLIDMAVLMLSMLPGYCKVISLQLIKINDKKKDLRFLPSSLRIVSCGTQSTHCQKPLDMPGQGGELRLSDSHSRWLSSDSPSAAMGISHGACPNPDWPTGAEATPLKSVTPTDLQHLRKVVVLSHYILGCFVITVV